MKKEHKVGNVTWGIMILIGIIIDITQALLALTGVGAVVGSGITIAADFAFGLWFAILGVSLIGKGGKKALTGAAALVADTIPLVNALPATTIGIIVIVLLDRAEEAAQNVAVKPSRQAVIANMRRSYMQSARRQAVANDNAQRDQQHVAANDNVKEDTEHYNQAA